MKRTIHLTGFLLLISLIFFAGCSEDNPTVPPSEHFEPEGWLIRDATQKPILVVFQGIIQNNWNNQNVSDTLYAPLNALSDHLTVKFLDINKNIINTPSGADHQFGWAIGNSALLEIIRDNPTDWAFHLKGLQEGVTTLELQVLHSGHVDVRTPKIPVIIKEDTSAHGEPVGLRLIDEHTGLELASADASSSSRSIKVEADSTTDHIKIEFRDEQGHYFQPEYPLHTLNYSVADGTIAEIIPENNELWVIRVKGLKTGTTTLVLKLMVGGNAEFTAYPINITVN